MTFRKYWDAYLSNKMVLIAAIKTSLWNFFWVYGMVGVLVAYSVQGISLQIKVLMFMVLGIGFFVIYFTTNCVVKLLMLRDENKCADFVNLTPQEQGRSIGDTLSGW